MSSTYTNKNNPFLRCANKHSQLETFSQPYFNTSFSNYLSHNSQRMTVQMSLKKNDRILHTRPWFGPFVSWQTNPSVWTFRFLEFSIFFVASSIFTLIKADTSSAACPAHPGSLDMISMTLLLLSFVMLMILVQWILRMIQNHLSQYRLGVQLDLCIFDALPPIRHSSNDRCPSVRRPSSLLHRSLLSYFWLSSSSTPESFPFFPFFIHCCFCCRNFHGLGA